MWQLDRTTSGTSAGEDDHRRASECSWVRRLLPPTANFRRSLIWVPWEVVVAYVILLSLSRFSPLAWFACFLVALNLLTVGLTRMCWQTISRGQSRVTVVGMLSVAVVISAACLQAIPAGVSGRSEWFWTTISLAGIVAVPLFLVVTGFTRLPRSFWSFAGQQLAGFVTAASVLLVFLGAYGRQQELFSTHSTIWQLAKSLGLLLVQGAKDLASGDRIAPGAKATDVVEYVIGWIVFVLIAGVEVSIISNRASEELARIESKAMQVHASPTNQPGSRWRWPRK
jgi:hypothetical protein